MEPHPGAGGKLADGPPVDSDDEWAGVGQFSSFQQFRELVKTRADLVTLNLTHQLATFALSRTPGLADRQLLPPSLCPPFNPFSLNPQYRKRSSPA